MTACFLRFLGPSRPLMLPTSIALGNLYYTTFPLTSLFLPLLVAVWSISRCFLVFFHLLYLRLFKITIITCAYICV